MPQESITLSLTELIGQHDVTVTPDTAEIAVHHVSFTIARILMNRLPFGSRFLKSPDNDREGLLTIHFFDQCKCITYGLYLERITERKFHWED